MPLKIRRHDKKVEYLCGSIEAFLKNPSMLNEIRGNPNFKWMRTVTPEEAKNCLERMSIWANTENKPSKSPGLSDRKNSFGQRVYKPLQEWEVGLDGEPGLELALTPWCAQYMWRAPAYFPCCPREFGTDPVDDYFQNLKVGAVLAYSDHDDFCPKFTVLEAVVLKKRSSILVMSERADNKWSIVGIERYERSRHFIHFLLGLYSTKHEADKAFCAKKELTDFVSEGYANGYDGLLNRIINTGSKRRRRKRAAAPEPER